MCLSAAGQQGAVEFKHFKQYPTGQWSQQIQGYRNGAPSGPPSSAMSCSAPLNASTAAKLNKLGTDAAPTCRTTLLVDEERTAEYEQVCNTGSQQQVIHATMRALDARTLSMEIRDSIGGKEISSAKITSRYVGACPEGQASPAGADLPSMPKLSPEQCAGLPAMKQEADEAGKSCTTGDLTEAEKASCKAAMQRLTDEVQHMAALCRP